MLPKPDQALACHIVIGSKLISSLEFCDKGAMDFEGGYIIQSRFELFSLNLRRGGALLRMSSAHETSQDKFGSVTIAL